jgi:competence ComEA-like helix-hairpin-helix protein
MYAPGLVVKFMTWYERPSLATAQDVEKHLTLRDPRGNYACQPASGDWNYICARDFEAGPNIWIRQPVGVKIEGGELPRKPTALPDPGAALRIARLREKKLILDQTTLDLNFATVTELTRLLGISRKLAVAIVRENERQRFATVNDLLRVEGMDREAFERIRPLVRAGRI